MSQRAKARPEPRSVSAVVDAGSHSSRLRSVVSIRSKKHPTRSSMFGDRKSLRKIENVVDAIHAESMTHPDLVPPEV